MRGFFIPMTRKPQVFSRLGMNGHHLIEQSKRKFAKRDTFCNTKEYVLDRIAYKAQAHVSHSLDSQI